MIDYCRTKQQEITSKDSSNGKSSGKHQIRTIPYYFLTPKQNLL